MKLGQSLLWMGLVIIGVRGRRRNLRFQQLKQVGARHTMVRFPKSPDRPQSAPSRRHGLQQMGKLGVGIPRRALCC